MTRPEDELVVGDHLDPDERDIEAPPADAAEQAAPVEPEDHNEPAAPPQRGLEVGEWDAFEQSIVVDLEDEYDY